MIGVFDMYVQFEDENALKIISILPGPQDSEVFQNQGEVGRDDPRFIAYVEATGFLGRE